MKYSYKKGILLGLILYATGALLFWPAAQYEMFGFFLVSLYILTFGLAFLETVSNPYILSMGDESTSTRRLNLAQAFNPLGSITGMFVASKIILASLESEKRDAAGDLIFPTLSAAERAVIRTNDLAIIRDPYVMLGVVVLIMFFIILLTKLPKTEVNAEIDLRGTFTRLFKNKRYIAGVFAQIFYVGAQIMCWTFIIQYGENIGISKSAAQDHNIAAMAIFVTFRFISTYLMKFVSASRLLGTFGLLGVMTLTGAIFIDGYLGLYCLVATSAFMSLMFPTIYGIALEDVEPRDAKLGAAGLVMAIVGGAVLPFMQASIIDLETIGSMAAINVSFVLPLICLLIVGVFGFGIYRSDKKLAVA
jgi:FHS family L-fucose permease-like MFS transporter